MGEMRVHRRERRGSAYEFRAFACADRIDAVAEAGAAGCTATPLADVDEGENCAVAHDQVEFAVAAAEISRHQDESGAFQARRASVSQSAPTARALALVVRGFIAARAAC